MAEFEITEAFIAEIEANIENKEKLLELTGELHPGDIADIIERRLSQQNSIRLFGSLDPETAAEVIISVENDEHRELLLENSPSKKIAEIVYEMDSDDAADFLGELPDIQSQEVLSHLPIKDSAEVRSLLQYPEDSAGGIMQIELISLNEEESCSDAITHIRKHFEEVQEFHNIYVTDKEGVLTGVVSLPQLILNKTDTSLKEIMESSPISVKVLSDVEEVALVFRKYDIVSLPVVDAGGRLLGRILHDDILDVITEENTEDILIAAGTNEQEFDTGSWVQASRYRLPWLLSSLMGGVVMAGIINKLGTPLEQVLALAAFIPVITGMSGNVSTQSSAIVVRAIVLGKMEGSGLGNYIQKEFIVGIVMASTCGSLIGFVGWFLEQNSGIGFVVGLALFASMAFASMLGTLIPLILHKLKFDPVLGAGPIVLTTVDISALTIYFVIARLLLSFIL